MGFAVRMRPDPRESWTIRQLDLRSGSNRKFALAQLKNSKETWGLFWVLRRIWRKSGGVSLGKRLRLRRSGTQLRRCKRTEEIWEAS